MAPNLKLHSRPISGHDSSADAADRQSSAASWAGTRPPAAAKKDSKPVRPVANDFHVRRRRVEALRKGPGHGGDAEEKGPVVFLGLQKKGVSVASFFLLQALLGALVFGFLYNQSFQIELNELTGKYKLGLGLKMFGLTETTPHSLRNGALSFLMLAVTNLFACNFPTNKPLRLQAWILNFAVVGHHTTEAFCFGTLNRAAALAILMLSLSALLGYKFRCGIREDPDKKD